MNCSPWFEFWICLPTDKMRRSVPDYAGSEQIGPGIAPAQRKSLVLFSRWIASRSQPQWSLQDRPTVVRQSGTGILCGRDRRPERRGAIETFHADRKPVEARFGQ